MFRSTEPGQADKVDLIMDVIPGEEPSAGPNYYNFDPSVAYKFHVDNNTDGKADDIEYEFRFTNELRGIVKDAGLPLSYVALPPITALDGPGSEGLGHAPALHDHDDQERQAHAGLAHVGQDRGAVRTSARARCRTTTPSPPQGMYDLGGGIKVFAGQRDDPFFIDLGAAFDTLNLRSPGTDMLSGFNVNTIALQVPAGLLTNDHRAPGLTDTRSSVRYEPTSRPGVTVRGSTGSWHGQPDTRSQFVQVSRLANPLVNESDHRHEGQGSLEPLEPEQEKQFLDYYENPRFALSALDSPLRRHRLPSRTDLGTICSGRARLNFTGPSSRQAAPEHAMPLRLDTRTGCGPRGDFAAPERPQAARGRRDRHRAASGRVGYGPFLHGRSG